MRLVGSALLACALGAAAPAGAQGNGTTVTLDVFPESVHENVSAGESVRVGATAGAQLNADLTIRVSVEPGTASTSDYAAVTPFDLTIRAGTIRSEATFTFDPVDDLISEADETVLVTGSAPGATVEGVELLIADNDRTTVTISGPASVVEGDSFEFTLTRTPPKGAAPDFPLAALDVPIEVELSGRGFFAALDTAGFKTVSIPAGQSTATHVVQTRNEPVFQEVPTETPSRGITARLRHMDDQTHDLGDESSATTAVTDNDPQLVVSIEQPNSGLSVEEGDDGFELNVVATTNSVGTPNGEYQVGVLTRSGTALSGVDFRPLSAVVRFAASNWTSVTVDGKARFRQAVAVPFTSLEDDVDEADETVKLVFRIINGHSLHLYAEAETDLTITDDDERGVTVSPTALSVPEGGDATYTVALDSEPTDVVTVTLTLSGDADVTASDEELLFGTDDWSEAQTVTVSAAQDSDAANDSATVAHGVSGGDYESTAADSVAVTVDDDEAASTRVDLSVSPDEVAEGAGATTVTVTAKLNGRTRSAATPVAVTVGSSTATSGTDFDAVTGFSIEIGANSASQTGTFTLTPTQDDIDEADEKVAVSGSTTTAGLTVTGAEVTILDDDARGVTVSTTKLSFAEGGSGTYTVALDSEPTEDVTVTPAISGDADVTVSGALRFTPGNWSQAQTVTVSAAHDSDAADDTATVAHDVAGGDYAAAAAESVAVAVDDDETASTRVDLSVSPDEVAEGAGTTTVTVTAKLNGGTRLTATPVAVTVGSGTATSGADFDAVPVLSMEIPVGSASQTATFTLTPTQDDIDEEDETAVVSGATTVAGLDVAGTEVAILDDDELGVTVSPTALGIPEGGSGAYTVALDSEPTGNVTVTPTVSGDADVTVSGELTFTPGDWSQAQTVTVSAAQDGDVVNDFATVAHSLAGGGYGSATAASVAVTVDDDEGASAFMMVANTAQADSDAPTSNNKMLNGVVAKTHEVEVVRAQRFTTGGNPDGYLVSEIRVVQSSPVRQYAARYTLHGTGTTSDGQEVPGAKLADLRAARDFVDPHVAASFVPHPAIELEPQTRYFVRFAAVERSGGSVLQMTHSDEVDAGAAAGWDISDVSLRKEIYDSFSNPSGEGFDTVGHSVKMSVHGLAMGGPPGREGRSGGGGEGGSGTPNRLPSGEPAIAGVARVGEALSADTSGIDDPDGLSEADFAFQWQSDANGAWSGIPGATGRTYVPREDDAGARLRVRVTFTDDGLTKEALFSAPTDEVQSRRLLTARFESVPASHDGQSPFRIVLAFSEELDGLSYRTLHDDALEATGGTVVDVRRRKKGSNLLWNIKVRPSGDGDVTVTLPSRECGAVGAICTADGRRLSNSPTVTVSRLPSARFESVPASHDGHSSFRIVLTFSENISGLGYRTLRDEALESNGGRVVEARRRNLGSNLSWIIRVRPSGDGDVTVSLPSRECGSVGAICTADGRRLSNSPTATVPGPGSKAVDGTTLTVGWGVGLDGFSAPAPNDFVAMVDGAPRPVSAVSLGLDRMELELSAPVRRDQAVTLDYLPAAMHPLRDAEGRAFAPWRSADVANVTGQCAASPLGRCPPRGGAGWEAAAAWPADSLNADASDAPEVREIGRMTSLRRLRLAGSGIDDVSALAGLTGLSSLDLSGNRISDLWPLSGLAGLERLDLSGNRIEDLTPLSGLPRLDVLLLDDNAIQDVGPLTHMRTLRHLGLSNNRIRNVGPLADLYALKRLGLKGNPVADASAVGDLGALVWLSAPDGGGPQAQWLGRLTRLRWLADPTDASPAMPSRTGSRSEVTEAVRIVAPPERDQDSP